MAILVNENVVIEDNGDLYLILDENDVDISKLHFEYDYDSGNCYIDESEEV